MSEKEQVQALADDLDKLIERYCDEFDLSAAAAVGVLMFKAHLIMANAQRSDESDS